MSCPSAFITFPQRSEFRVLVVPADAHGADTNEPGIGAPTGARSPHMVVTLWGPEVSTVSPPSKILVVPADVQRADINEPRQRGP